LQKGPKLMITILRRQIDSRTGSTTVMFAAFAAVVAIGILSMAKPVSRTMMAAIHKQAPIRY